MPATIVGRGINANRSRPWGAPTQWFSDRKPVSAGHHTPLIRIHAGIDPP
mgnify:CR=1 FL=1